MLENNELVKVNPVQIEAQHIKFNGYGIEFEGSPSIEEWYQTFQSLQHYNGIFQFCLGDLIVYAEVTSGWGESKYKTLMEETGYAYDTLKQFARVSRRFDTDFRKQVYPDTHILTLTWRHFQEVAPLPEDNVAAKHFLEMVRDGGWSVAKLKDEVARYKNGGTLPEPKGPMELPNGWASFRELPKELGGYVPSPERIDGVKQSKIIEIEDWELEILQEFCDEDPRLISLLERITRALGD